jgi:beta-glucanase (GH16 family)
MEANQYIRANFMWISLAAVLLLVFAACGSRDAASTQEPARTATPETSLGDHPPGTAEVVVITAGPLATAESVVATAEPLIATAEPRIVAPEPGASSSRSGATQARGSRAGECVCRWQLTFEDEFEGDRLDTTIWDTGYKAGDKEAQYYVEDAFELEDGILKIRAEERQVNDRKYASGIITTQGTFDQRYGRFVVRAKVPAGQGLWPAFWLMPSSRTHPPEIDVFEILGHEPDTVYMTNHWRDESGRKAFETRGFKGSDFSQNFHVYRIDWMPDEIVWLVDGYERARETRGIPDGPMFLLLNLAVGGEWPGYPDETTPFPSYLEVDYVRAYAWTCPDIAAEEPQDEDLQTE